MDSLQDIVSKFYHDDVNELKVNEAKRIFDVFFEHICEECMDNDLEVPSWDEAFGIWCSGSK